MSSKSKTSQESAVNLADYLPPAFLVDAVALDFDIGEKRVAVKSRMMVRRNPESRDKKSPLILDGENQKLIAVTVNGKKLSPSEYDLSERRLVISGISGNAAVVEIESSNDPKLNTALSGLYAAGPMLCTQCEAEGFRRITYYPDRPDVLAKFTVTIHADRKKFPSLLSNGNLIASGGEGNGRHWAKWQDPFPKPCYLFALVAGKLDKVKDEFVTKSGRKVLLEIYVEPGRKADTGFAMAALKQAMAWDEKTYGLEYDLDRFMIVAVSFFNMGAMENKGLNIFNDACVLGRSDTATDSDIDFIERVVGHEYFHNWTGNRVTCRDWFQLSLKEGLTVFREQEFCGDMRGRALERISAVSGLRRAQFAEDAGAMAHAVRPASYKAIDNFYTSTVYQKGSEVVRMIQTMIGRANFRKGLNLYLGRNDGKAATCEDFVAAMSQAGNIDLSQFMRWYAQAGTPRLEAKEIYNAKARRYSLRVRQSCPPTPGQKTKRPFHMPLSVGLLSAKGKDLCGTKILHLRKEVETFAFENIDEKPIASLLRDFSAPVRLESGVSDADLLFLMSHDSDSFNRWEAAQKLYMRLLLSLLSLKNPKPLELSPKLVAALGRVLCDSRMDAAVRAMTLTLPSEAEIGMAVKISGKPIDPAAVYSRRRETATAIACALREDLWKTHAEITSSLSENSSDGAARGQRSLKNLCLGYLSRAEETKAAKIAHGMVVKSRSMTDKIAGLSILADGKSPERAKALEWFEKKYAGHPSIMDEWLSVQAAARQDGVLKDVARLTRHSAFAFNNPNRVSALIGVFCGNPFGLHSVDGKGYRFASEIIAKVDKLNPHASARLAKVFLRWRDYESKRQALMKAELKRLAALSKLSVNCREVVESALSASVASTG